jgi:hypothetical protein
VTAFREHVDLEAFFTYHIEQRSKFGEILSKGLREMTYQLVMCQAYMIYRTMEFKDTFE